jgi:hypothetical protein
MRVASEPRACFTCPPSEQSSELGNELHTGDFNIVAAHLPIGARLRAWSIVDGERLESDAFDMPAESGVRVLLVAGSGAGVPVAGSPGAGGETWLPGASATLPPNHPPLPDVSAAIPVAAASASEGVLAVRAVLLTATVFAFGIVYFRRPRRR